MKQQTFPVSVSKKTKGMLPAFIYGFIAAAAVIALPFIPLVAKNVSPLTQLIDAIKDLQNTNSDPTKYLSILKLVFPIMTLILSLVTLIRLIVRLCNVGKGQIGALRMTGTYFSVISILVSYLTYLLFFTSLLNLSSEVKKELYESFKYLTVSEYGKYYIAYGAIAGVGLLVSAIGNWTSSLTRPNAGMTVYKAIRFICAAVALVMVLYLPIVSVSYGSGKTSLMKLLASGNKDAMFVISNSGMECNAEKIEQIGGFIKNAFTGGGDDVTPTLLAIFYVNFVPFILLIAAFSATLKTLRALVQPSEEVLYDCRANNGDELDSTNYKRLKKPKKLGVGVSVFAFIAATFLLGAGFGFGPVATIMKLTSYSNLKVVLAPVLTVYLFVYGIALIVYVSVYNTQLDARLAAENAAQVKSEEQSQANEETVATTAEETTEAPALIAPVAETTSEATAAPAEEATAPAEEQPAEAADEPTEEVKAEEAEGAEVTAPAAEEVAPETQEAVEEPAEEDTAADVEETAVPEAEEKEVVTEPQAKVEETPTIAEEPAAPVQEKAEEKSLSNYERVEKEYEAYIAESNDMLRKYYKRIKELRAAAEEDNLDVAERTTREAEYERALERKRSYVYESGLIIKGYKSRLASIKELDEE
ncbi:MAG: hypothetical protein PUI94_02245 [Eubacteriales bacterium]|nr:hypothetical protein [Eubacteriales bacterium]